MYPASKIQHTLIMGFLCIILSDQVRASIAAPSHVLDTETAELISKFTKETAASLSAARIGKVKIKKVQSASGHDQTYISLFENFIDDHKLDSLMHELEKAKNDQNESEFYFRGCDENSLQSKISFSGQCSPSSKVWNKKIKQMEFSVLQGSDGASHQVITITGGIHQQGWVFVEKKPLPPLVLLQVRSDSWDTIIRKALLPTRMGFGSVWRKAARKTLGMGSWFHTPENLPELSKAFYKNQDLRIALHALGTTLEAAGVYYFSKGFVNRHQSLRELKKISQRFAKIDADHWARKVYANGKNQGTGSSLLASQNTLNFLGDGKSLSQILRKNKALEKIYRRSLPKMNSLYENGATAKHALNEWTNFFAAASLSAHVLHIDQLLDFVDDENLHQAVEAAIAIIHVGAILGGTFNGSLNVYSHLGRHSSVAASTKEAIELTKSVKDIYNPRTLKNALEVLERARIVSIMQQIFGKELSRDMIQVAWKTYRQTGSSFHAMVEVTHKFGHAHTGDQILKALACPLDDIIVAALSLQAGGQGAHKHSLFKDEHSKEEHSHGRQ